MVKRRFEDQKLVFFAVLYRQGKYVGWVYKAGESAFPRKPNLSDPNLECPLSAEELREFHQVRDQEMQRFIAAGGSASNQYEGCEMYVIISGLHDRSHTNYLRGTTAD